MITGYRLSMYKNIIWNTGPAAMRARARAQRDAGQFNLKLKKKKRPRPEATSHKPQAPSFKRLKKDTMN